MLQKVLSVFNKNVVIFLSYIKIVKEDSSFKCKVNNELFLPENHIIKYLSVNFILYIIGKRWLIDKI